MVRQYPVYAKVVFRFKRGGSWSLRLGGGGLHTGGLPRTGSVDAQKKLNSMI